MKPNLLLLHGALGSKKQFQSVKPILETKFHVYGLNFEGHGGLPSSEDYAIELFVKNALDFLDANKIESTNIFGYSMGGYVALRMALQHSERIEKIVTLGTKFDWNLEAANKEVRMLNPDKIAEKVPKFARKLEAEHEPEDWKIVVKKTAQMMLGLANGKALNEDDFRQIENEVTIGLGSEDKMVTAEESKQVAEWLLNSKFVVINDFLHPIDKVDTDKLAQYIISSMEE